MAGAEAIAFFQAFGNESRVPMFLCLRLMEAHLDLSFPHLSIPRFLVFNLSAYRHK
jgi:hypothetical protein